MASYKQIGENKYKITVELGYNDSGKRIRKTKTVMAKSERALKKAITELEMEARNTNDIYLDKTTIEYYYKNQFLPLYVDKLKVNTQNSYHQHEKTFLDFFKDMQLKKIKPLHVQKYFDNEEKNGRKCTDVKFKRLKSIFQRAVEWELIDSNPARKVKVKHVKTNRSVKFYDKKQVKILLEELEKEQNIKFKTIVKLALYCGLRIGEILALSYDSFDFGNKTIKIDKNLQYSDVEKKHVLSTTKTEYERYVPIPEPFISDLKLYLLESKKNRLYMDNYIQPIFKDNKEVKLIFLSKSGLPLHKSCFGRDWKNFIKKTNLPYINVHGLRHTFATLLIQKGTNIKKVQEILGHSKISMTLDMYTHVTAEDKRKAVDVFSNL